MAPRWRYHQFVLKLADYQIWFSCVFPNFKICIVFTSTFIKNGGYITILWLSHGDIVKTRTIDWIIWVKQFSPKVESKWCVWRVAFSLLGTSYPDRNYLFNWRRKSVQRVHRNGRIKEDWAVPQESVKEIVSLFCFKGFLSSDYKLIEFGFNISISSYEKKIEFVSRPLIIQAEIDWLCSNTRKTDIRVRSGSITLKGCPRCPLQYGKRVCGISVQYFMQHII